MPWPCFVCGSPRHDCGHREHDLVMWARAMEDRRPVVADAPVIAAKRVNMAISKPPVIPVREPRKTGIRPEYSELRGW